MRLREHLRDTLRAREAAGLRRRLPGPPGDPRRDFSSNDYLGLARDPALRAALDAATTLPNGGAASRLLSGDHEAHHAAESALADLVQSERALLFSSGYAANVSAIPALVGRGDLILSDALNHASLIDGCRLSRARVLVLPHGDLEAFEAALRTHRPRHRLCLIVTDAVFSMDGDAAPLAGLSALADTHEADLFVDEAHALGLRGTHGAGLCAELGIRPTALLGTLGKSLGLAGAFVAGDSVVIEHLLGHARGFVYSTALAPRLAAAIPTAVRLARHGDGRRERLRRHARAIRDGIEHAGFPSPSVPGPILPLVVGSAEAATRASGLLAGAGLHVPAIRPPTVPAGAARLRIVPRADHEPQDVERLVDALATLRPPDAPIPWTPRPASS